MKKLNLNQWIKVKLTDHGKDIYYHQNDELIDIMKERGLKPLTRSYPSVDENGYSHFQLWCFIAMYGPYINMGLPNVIEDLCIYIDERDLDDVDAPLEAVIPLRKEED